MTPQPWGGTNTSEGVSVSSLLYHALRLARVTLGPQRTPSPDQYADALMAFNRFLGSLGTHRASIWSIQKAQYPLVPGQGQYAIGQGADFDTTRPQLISRANVVDGADHLPLKIIQDEQWSELRLPDTTGRPQKLWPDMQVPLAYLNLWPVPDAAYSLELFTGETLTKAASINDYLLYPEGYEQAIVTNLAVNLCQLWGNTVHPDLREEAKRSLAAALRMNLPKPIMDSDLPGILRGVYDIRTNQ